MSKAFRSLLYVFDCVCAFDFNLMSPVFRFVPLAALLSASAFLSGCGGGGSGLATPKATPTSSAVYVPSGCDATTYSPNYIAQNSSAGDSSQAGFTYWRHFPISIYIAPTDSATRAATIAGFSQWASATGNRASYSLVSNSTGADLSVTFSPDNQPADSSGYTTVGLTTVSYFRDNHISSATMQLFILAADGSANSDDNASGFNQTVAAHEFGHALGIGPHSLNAGDLMYFAVDGSTGVKSVTTRDLNTLKSVYCNTFPTVTGSALERQSSAVNGTIKTFTLPPLQRVKK